METLDVVEASMESPMEVSAARSVGYRSSSTSSARSVARKLSDGALSRQSPLRLMLATMACATSAARSLKEHGGDVAALARVFRRDRSAMDERDAVLLPETFREG